MGQKVNPISLRLEKTNRHFDSFWYDDYNYTRLLLQDLNIKNYIKTVYSLIKYPEGRILIENLPKKTNVNLFYSNPTNSRRKKNKRFQLQDLNINKQKENIKDRKKRILKKKNYVLQIPNFFPLPQKRVEKTSVTHSALSLPTKNFVSFEKIGGKRSSSIGNRMGILSKLENFVVKPRVNNIDTNLGRERFIIGYLLAQFYLNFLQNKGYTYISILSKSFILFSYFILSSQLKNTKNIKNIQTEKRLSKDSFKNVNLPHSIPPLSSCLIEDKHLSILYSKKSSKPVFCSLKKIYKPQLESVLSKEYNTILNLNLFRSLTDKQSAFFLVQEIIHYLERKVPFRRIKSQLLREIVKYKPIKGIRITCSGRVGGRSKKAQRSKTQSAKIGQTSLGVFSSKIDFACKSAYTRFGLIGVKLWICYQ